MANSLREAWTNLVRAEDYESHMAGVGQAQANALLVEDYLRTETPEKDCTILFAGAGTGQMFEFISPSTLLPFETTFTDINPAYLRVLAMRLRSTNNLRYVTAVDDVENTAMTETFSLIVVVLVLEHVDWRKAVASLVKLAKANIFVILQENPPSQATAINPARPIAGSMKVFIKVHPQMIPRDELVAEFCLRGFACVYSEDKSVADGKKMLGLGFQRTK